MLQSKNLPKIKKSNPSFVPFLALSFQSGTNKICPKYGYLTEIRGAFYHFQKKYVYQPTLKRN
jgi:hypothetical protein